MVQGPWYFGGSQWKRVEMMSASYQFALTSSGALAAGSTFQRTVTSFSHPDLLSERVEKFLAEVAPHSSTQAYAFARMRILFRRCKEIGIDRAFDEEKIKQQFREFVGNGDFGANES
jgi:hypothetical protein